MINEALREIISKRIEMHPEYDYGIENCWKQAIFIVKENVDETINFLEYDATDEEVYWFSEILCDIYDAVSDERVVDVFRRRAEKMEDLEMKRSVNQEISHI